MMRIYTLLAIAFWLAYAQTTHASPADELAREIIRQERATAHNVSDDTFEELVRVTAVNSRISLQSLMLNDKSISEYVRICYAIRIIDDQLGLHRIRIIRECTPQEEVLMKKRLSLAEGLIHLNKSKMQNKAEMAMPRKPSD